jgi:hypothetical protein
MAILSGTTARSFSPNPDDSGSGGGRRSRPDIGLPWASADQSVLGAALELQIRELAHQAVSVGGAETRWPSLTMRTVVVRSRA